MCPHTTKKCQLRPRWGCSPQLSNLSPQWDTVLPTTEGSSCSSLSLPELSNHACSHWCLSGLQGQPEGAHPWVQGREKAQPQPHLCTGWMDGWIPTVSTTVSQGLQLPHQHACKTQHSSTKKNKPLCQALLFARCPGVRGTQGRAQHMLLHGPQKLLGKMTTAAVTRQICATHCNPAASATAFSHFRSNRCFHICPSLQTVRAAVG